MNFKYVVLALILVVAPISWAAVIDVNVADLNGQQFGSASQITFDWNFQSDDNSTNYLFVISYDYNNDSVWDGNFITDYNAQAQGCTSVVPDQNVWNCTYNYSASSAPYDSNSYKYLIYSDSNVDANDQNGYFWIDTKAPYVTNWNSLVANGRYLSVNDSGNAQLDVNISFTDPAADYGLQSGVKDINIKLMQGSTVLDYNDSWSSSGNPWRVFLDSNNRATGDYNVLVEISDDFNNTDTNIISIKLVQNPDANITSAVIYNHTGTTSYNQRWNYYYDDNFIARIVMDYNDFDILFCFDSLDTNIDSTDVNVNGCDVASISGNTFDVNHDINYSRMDPNLGHYYFGGNGILEEYPVVVVARDDHGNYTELTNHEYEIEHFQPSMYNSADFNLNFPNTSSWSLITDFTLADFNIDMNIDGNRMMVQFRDVNLFDGNILSVLDSLNTVFTATSPNTSFGFFGINTNAGPQFDVNATIDYYNMPVSSTWGVAYCAIGGSCEIPPAGKITSSPSENGTTVTFAVNGFSGYQLDSNAPVVTITTNYSGWMAQAPQLFAGTTYDNESDINNVKITIDRTTDNQYWTGAAWGTLTYLDANYYSNNDWNYNLSGVSFDNNGRYELCVISTNNADLNSGNTSNCVDFNLDLQNPALDINNPSSGWYNATTLPAQFDGNASDGESGLKDVNVTLLHLGTNQYYTGSAWSSATPVYLAATLNPTTGDWNYTLPTLPDDNSYRFCAIVRDYVDRNNGNTTDCVDVNYDTTNPTATISTPTTSTWKTSFPSSITGTASDSFSGVAQVQIRIHDANTNQDWNGADWNAAGVETWLNATGTTNWSYNSSGVAAKTTDGHHYIIFVRVTDNAQNMGYSADVNAEFNIDSTKPTATINNISTNQRFISSTTGEPQTHINVNVTATDTTSGLNDINVKLVSGATTYDLNAVQNVGSTSPYTRTYTLDTNDLNYGDYNILVEFSDVAGNLDTNYITIKIVSNPDFNINSATVLKQNGTQPVSSAGLWYYYSTDDDNFIAQLTMDYNDFNVLVCFDSFDANVWDNSYNWNLSTCHTITPNGYNYDINIDFNYQDMNSYWGHYYSGDSNVEAYPVVLFYQDAMGNAKSFGYLDFLVVSDLEPRNLFASPQFDMNNDGTTWWRTVTDFTQADLNFDINVQGYRVFAQFYDLNLTDQNTIQHLAQLSSIMDVNSPLSDGNGFFGVHTETASEFDVNADITVDDVYLSGHLFIIKCLKYNFGSQTWSAATSSDINYDTIDYNSTTHTLSFHAFHFSGYQPDATPPVITSVTPPNGSYVNSQVHYIQGTASDASNIADVNIALKRASDGYYWNGSSWSNSFVWLDANSTTGGDWNYYIDLNDGNYEVRVIAFDAADNNSEQNGDTNVVWFVQDTTSPSSQQFNITPTLTNIDANTFGASSTITLDINFTDNVPGVSGSTLSYVSVRIYDPDSNKYWNGSTWVDSAYDVNIDFNTDTNNGTYQFGQFGRRVRISTTAHDRAGNTTTKYYNDSSDHNIIMDQNAPDFNFYINYNTYYVDTNVNVPVFFNFTDLDVYDNNVQVMLSNSSNFDSNSGWLNLAKYTTAWAKSGTANSNWFGYYVDWNLDSNSGNQTVYAKIKDATGNIATQTYDTIVVNTSLYKYDMNFVFDANDQNLNLVSWPYQDQNLTTVFQPLITKNLLNGVFHYNGSSWQNYWYDYTSANKLSTISRGKAYFVSLKSFSTQNVQMPIYGAPSTNQLFNLSTSYSMVGFDVNTEKTSDFNTFAELLPAGYDYNVKYWNSSTQQYADKNIQTDKVYSTIGYWIDANDSVDVNSVWSR